VFDVNSLVATISDVYSTMIEVNLDKKFAYQSAGSKYGKFKNLYLIICPYVNGGTLNTTSCGSVKVNQCTHYRDS